MDQPIKIALLDELLALDAQKTPYLDAQWVNESVERYHCEAIFKAEQTRIFRRLPQIAAHRSALPESNSYLVCEVGGISLLLTRDAEGVVRAFHNVCRHRGARLVEGSKGCQKRFSCPYHAWTYSNQGQLLGVPHQATGFPDLGKSQWGLKSVSCFESFGWIWVCLDESWQLDSSDHLHGLDNDLAALQCEAHHAFDSTRWVINANWKLLVEGGLESYHFKVAHRDTIAPLFLDNLSSYQRFGPHIRSVLPRATMTDLHDLPKQDWRIRAHCNLLYTFLPTTQFLVQADHFVWIQSKPISAGQTELTLTTMIQETADTGADAERYWTKNHALTLRTLKEDFELAEGIQANIESGATESINFGRFEGALAAFNQTVDDLLADA